MFYVSFIVITKKGNLESKVKSFKTHKAMEKFLAKIEESGNLYDILGYSQD